VSDDDTARYLVLKSPTEISLELFPKAAKPVESRGRWIAELVGVGDGRGEIVGATRMRTTPVATSLLDGDRSSIEKSEIDFSGSAIGGTCQIAQTGMGTLGEVVILGAFRPNGGIRNEH